MKPQYEIVTTTAGAVSIRDNDVNEIMHNPLGPWAEANSLYIDQSNLQKRLSEDSSEELVIFDVGLGAVTNAVAILQCFNETSSGTKRRLRLISFEKNLKLAEFALENAEHFPYYKGHESSIQTLLREGRWQGAGIDWELRHGDFLDLIAVESQRPHIIFFDPYSPKVNQEMWSLDCFKKLRAQVRTESQGGSLLYTYSQATPVRVALLAAGFFVGHGKHTGIKEETTVAATRRSDLAYPLADRWFKRWKNSQTPYPFQTALSDQKQIESRILNHPQFVN